MLRALALSLTFVTGVAGLVYEVTWERMLATLLGSHAAATASVLAFFLGGLALGYTVFGAYTRRITARRLEQAPRELLRSYGIVEASIGAYAIAFELLYAIARGLSLHGPSRPGLSFAWDAALAAALVLPGATLMGATIPILTQALSRGVADATRIHSMVYGLNTLGAFVGALSASYWLIPALGMVGTLRLMGLASLGAGLAYVALSTAPWRAQAAAPMAGTAPLRLGSLAAVACLLGFAMMTLQTALIRIGSLALGSSLFTFATVVGVFVLCIALGALGVGALSRVPRALLPLCAWGLLGWLALLYLPIQDAPYYAHRLRLVFRDHPAAFMPYQISVLASLLCLIGPAVALSGSLLPLIFDRLRREYGELGDAAGRLYGWNTAGSLLGALVGGYALYVWLDLHQIYRVALWTLAASAALLSPPLLPLARRWQPATLVGAAALALWLLPVWNPQHLDIGAFRMRKPTPESFSGPDAFVAQWPDRIAFHDDDPIASISVRESGGDGTALNRSIVTNGKSDGSVIREYTTTALLALLPAWLAQRAERAFVIGLGTGVTASELAMLEDMREVTVAEISPAVAAAQPLFDYANHDASHNPKIHVVQGDAYRVLLRSQVTYDVIVSEPSNPWVTGIENLYSAEFLQAARSRLSAGGVYSQWFHTYETSPVALGLVLRTYASVFDHVAIWFGLPTDLILLGINDPDSALDMPRLIQRVTREDFRAGFGRAGVSSFAALLGHELWPLDVLHALDMQGPIHTLLHPRLAHVAAQAFFAGDDSTLPPSSAIAASVTGARNSLMRRYTALRGGLPESERADLVKEICTLRAVDCVTHLAAWHADVPQSEARDETERWIRTHRARREPIDMQMPGRLQPLYSDSNIAPDDGTPLLQQLRDESLRFSAYYNHAVPFERAALASLFASCAGTPQAEECAALQREVESSLGPLDAPLPAGAGAPGVLQD